MDEYLQMIELKTAALIACALEIGVRLGGGDGRLAGAFRELGRNLGLAFQVQDDILGIWGDEAKTGKPVGSDIRRRKKSLPIVYALGRARPAARAALAQAYGHNPVDERGLATVLEVLDSTGARAEAERLARSWCDRAIAQLDGLPLSPPARHSLEEMAYFLSKREF